MKSTITNNKSVISLFFMSLTMLLFSACNDDSTGPGTKESQIETHTVADLPADTASTGVITYFSLQESRTVDASDSISTQWDIAFSGTAIYTNSGSSGPGEGGAVILDQSFDATVLAPSEGYNVDADTLLAIPAGSDNGWYHYTNMQEPQHAILPIENKTIVIKTADGAHYAKLQVMSYYKGNPDTSTKVFANLSTRPASPVYTFKYAIQRDGSTELR